MQPELLGAVAITLALLNASSVAGLLIYGEACAGGRVDDDACNRAVPVQPR